MDDEDIVYRDDKRRYGPLPDDNAPNLAGRGQRKRKPIRQPPQESIKQFWDKFNTKYPGKVFKILPDNARARQKATQPSKGAVQQRAAKSYEQARAECERNVQRIVKECRRVNQKYRDPHFDIEWDLKTDRRNCLNGLARELQGGSPKGVKRVTVCSRNRWVSVLNANPHCRIFSRNLSSTSMDLQQAMCGRGEMATAI
jgi:hypothetical protein